MKTSNFSSYKGNRGVSIAGKSPYGFSGREYKKLAPSYSIWKEYHDSKDFKRYTERYYNEILLNLNPQEVYNELGDDAVLLCYENPGLFCHRRLVANWLSFNLKLDIPEIVTDTNLECSSIGDKRFSAFYAAINFFGKKDTIEKIYQEAKRFGHTQLSFKEAKGRKPSYFVIENKEFRAEHLSSFYKLLWILYFKENPYYLDYINNFDSFSDKFKGKSINCQADVITQIKLFGLSQMIKEIEPFLDTLRKEGLQC